MYTKFIVEMIIKEKNRQIEENFFFEQSSFRNYVIFHSYLELHSIELKVERLDPSARYLCQFIAIYKRPFLSEN